MTEKGCTDCCVSNVQFSEEGAVDGKDGLTDTYNQQYFNIRNKLSPQMTLQQAYKCSQQGNEVEKNSFTIPKTK